MVKLISYIPEMHASEHTYKYLVGTVNVGWATGPCRGISTPIDMVLALGPHLLP